MKTGMVFLGFYRKDMRFEKQNYDVLIVTDEIGVENWYNILANKLGFDNLKSYIESYPDKFHSGRSMNHYDDNMLYLWCSGVYNGNTRIMLNVLQSYLIGENNVDYNYISKYCKSSLSELIIAPTMKEFKTYNKLKSRYGKNDLWFCLDWRENT